MPSDTGGEPVWVPLDVLIAINAYAVSVTGEPHIVRDKGLLESAWVKPRNRWAYEGEGDLVRLAVALMAGVAQNHPFQQGNKRTAFAAGVPSSTGTAMTSIPRSIRRLSPTPSWS